MTTSSSPEIDHAAVVREFRQNSMNSCASFYMTMISIIQSLALGYFATQVEWRSFSFSVESALQILMYVLAVQMIVVTWHEYSIGSIFFKWPISYTDSWIPILLGISEYAVIFFCGYKDVEEFFKALSVFVIFALWAFKNQSRKSSAQPENTAAFIRLQPFLEKTQKCMALNSIAYSAMCLIIWFTKNPYITGGVLLLANGTFVYHALQNKRYYGKLFDEGRPLSKTAEALERNKSASKILDQVSLASSGSLKILP